MSNEPTRSRVHFQDEEAQAGDLAHQMFRSVKHQLEIASESVESIRWIETDGSKHIEGQNELALTEFELRLNSGKRIVIVSPIMNMTVYE